MARNKYDIDEELDSPFNAQQLKRALVYVKKYRRQIISIIIMMLVASYVGMIHPYLFKIVLDETIPNHDLKQLIVLSVIFALSIVATSIFTRIRIKTMSKVGQGIIHDIRKDLFEHLQTLPFQYYDSRPHGKILVRVVNYVNALSDLLSNGIINLMTDMFSLVVIIGFMFYTNVKLTLICLGGLPVLALVIWLLKNKQRKVWQQVSRKSSNINAYLHESLTGIKVTQAFTRENTNLGIFGKLNKAFTDAWIRAILVNGAFGPIIDMISIASICFVYATGIYWSTTADGITIGVLTAFVSYLGRFWTPIMNLGNFYNQIQVAAAYMERIFETMDEKVLVEDQPGAEDLPEVKGDVTFSDVNFSYDEGVKILDGINFDVKAGETVALVGPTGAGKTTIINLISRFYDLDSGTIEIDGHDIKYVTLASLRRQMGIMLQDTFIFSGTIADNIRYGKLDATDEEIAAAAKTVRAHEFIDAMKDGYQTQVNERGTRLSTGQRQLISFARALLADPRILILDEATSSIDTETELLLQEGLSRLLKGRTSFIIAHRLSTIKNADRIMYIDGGKIIESGTHDELIEMRGAYWKLYTAQYELVG